MASASPRSDISALFLLALLLWSAPRPARCQLLTGNTAVFEGHEYTFIIATKSYDAARSAFVFFLKKKTRIYVGNRTRYKISKKKIPNQKCVSSRRHCMSGEYGSLVEIETEAEGDFLRAAAEELGQEIQYYIGEQRRDRKLVAGVVR